MRCSEKEQGSRGLWIILERETGGKSDMCCAVGKDAERIGKSQI